MYASIFYVMLAYCGERGQFAGMEDSKVTGKARGGIARSRKLTKGARSEIARKAAAARGAHRLSAWKQTVLGS